MWVAALAEGKDPCIYRVPGGSARSFHDPWQGSMSCRNSLARQKYSQAQQHPERFICKDISLSLLPRNLVAAFYLCIYGRQKKKIYFCTAFHLHKFGTDVPFASSKWAHNFLSLLSSIICVYGRGFRSRENSWLWHSSCPVILKQSAATLKTFPL